MLALGPRSPRCPCYPRYSLPTLNHIPLVYRLQYRRVRIFGTGDAFSMASWSTQAIFEPDGGQRQSGVLCLAWCKSRWDCPMLIVGTSTGKVQASAADALAPLLRDESARSTEEQALGFIDVEARRWDGNGKQ